MQEPTSGSKSNALRFVVLVGILSFFADFTYEGSRSVVGPYLATLGAGALVVSATSGFGEFIGYGLRLFSGRAADRTRRYWLVAIFGYIVQMSSVPLLAFVNSWPAAAILVVLERVGKAIRNPPRDVMLSHAGSQIGHGWAFGLHEALDQFGAFLGPVAVVLIVAGRGNFRPAFVALAIPAALCLLLVVVARWIYPSTAEMEEHSSAVSTVDRFPRPFWIYLAAAGLIAAGFIDYPLIAFHLGRDSAFPRELIPALYAIAMAAGGIGSLVFGRAYDRYGFSVLIAVTAITLWFAPLAFLGHGSSIWVGAALWGLGTGVHESLIPAALAPMIAPTRRASAYGAFTTGYGLCWFLGSVVLGFLYSRSLVAVTVVSMALQAAAIPFLLAVRRQSKAAG